ncbi:MAG TPA: prolipoprotein diacylglyceryl transferase [Chloroflexota bacterium]|nr:prolipoprotein diacylglyceryl transferase [Chloroflexota bacterium]
MSHLDASSVLQVIKIDINPVLVKIGPLSIHWYGVMYVVGITVALFVVLPFAEQRGISRERALEIFFPVVIAGLIGGRLYYVVQSNFGYYLTHPLKILATWEGGMAFFGAIFASFLMILYLSWRKSLPFWSIMDTGALFAPLGQAFGRVGNIINGDIVGFRSNCAWCTQYINPHSFPARHDVAYQPAAAYELLISLAIFGVLYAFRFAPRRGGVLFAAYLMLYSISQFFIFFVRTEPFVALGLKQAQLTAIVTFIFGAALFTYLFNRGPILARRSQAGQAQPQSITPSASDAS